MDIISVMIVLGIESTCDETAAAVVKDGKEILSSVIRSQIELHEKYGGVFPEIASRQHIEDLLPVIDEALQRANVTLEDIDLIAAAQGPGLIGALLMGFNAGKTLALVKKKPFIGVNHVEAHLFATYMTQQDAITFPCLGLVLSGGHSALLKMESITKFSLIGQTVDDALGEAFDKCAKILGLPYPGGPEVERLAKRGKENFAFKAGQVKERPFAFSFSGLKTAVLYAARDYPEQKEDIAASFQKAAFEDVKKKALLAMQTYGLKCVLIGGGVAMNKNLRVVLEEKLPCFWPSREMTTDNAAMIAGLGNKLFVERGHGDPMRSEPYTQWKI